MRPQHVLVVARNRATINRLISWFSREEYELAVVTTFAAAKRHLQDDVDIVVAELKLGAYNGLHLAMRALSKGIPAIVIGPQDVIFQREAETIGALYVDASGSGERLLTALGTALGMTARLGSRADSGEELALASIPDATNTGPS